MTNILQDKIIDADEAASGIRNLTELFAAQSGVAKRRGMLFDEFWREGELAVLIGEPGVGKSLFAVGTADALACGRKFSGLKTPAEPLRVLYIDLVLSDAQFAARYSTRCETGETTFYKFAENFSYAKPPQETKDVEVWLFELLSKCEFDAAVIDDLSMLASMEKGSQEALRLMVGLRRVARERGVSLLLLADSERTACGRF